jgi:DNA-binding NarL/FixJ family response regulator
VPVRVAVADDHLLVREGLRQLLAGEAEVEVVASCGDLRSLLEAVDEDPPDVVLTDIRMPPTQTDEGIRIANRLRETHPEIGVVVLSQYDEPEYALKLLEGGSERRAYMLKDSLTNPATLVGAVHEVATGGSVIDPGVIDRLVRARSAVDGSPLRELTPRELGVLSEMAQGRNNDAIAAACHLSVRMVEKHINAIFSKLGLTEDEEVHRRVAAVLIYLSATGD